VYASSHSYSTYIKYNDFKDTSIHHITLKYYKNIDLNILVSTYGWNEKRWSVHMGGMKKGGQYIGVG
jgi:hypothetical protein